MKKIFSLLVIFSCLTFAVSCDKDDDADTTKPVIELDEPEDGDELVIGEGVHFECDFSDNVMLGSYMVEIHNNFDHHSHSKATDGTVPFFFKKEWSLNGLKNSHVHHHEIVIPENTTPGDYHLVVYCTDAAGNQSLVAREIEIVIEGEGHEHHHHEED